MSDDAATRDEPGPDEAWRIRATPEELDTEGHKKVLPRDAGPDEGIRRSGGAKDDDSESPGPDESKFSDRNLKVGIVPVEW